MSSPKSFIIVGVRSPGVLSTLCVVLLDASSADDAVKCLLRFTSPVPFSSDVLLLFSPATVGDSCVFGFTGFWSFSDCSVAIAWSSFDRLEKKFVNVDCPDLLLVLFTGCSSVADSRQKSAHPHTRALTYAHAYTHVPADTYAYTLACTYVHIRPHTRTHKRTDTLSPHI